MYQCRHFKIEELVPQYLFKQYEGNPAKLWLLFDDRLLRTADALRTRYGKMVCNTWFWGGSSHWRGWRPFNAPVGAELSQHKWGRALDLIPMGTMAEHIRQEIIDAPYREWCKEITCLEIEISWLHFDVRNSETLILVRP